MVSRQEKREAEVACRRIADFTQKVLPKGWTFFVGLYSEDKGGILTTLSPMEPASTIIALQETVQLLKDQYDLE